MTLKKLANVSSENISKAQQLLKLVHYQTLIKKIIRKQLELYLKASNFNPMEYSYLENAATSFFLLEDFGNAMIYSGKSLKI